MQQHAQALRRRSHFQRVGVRVHALRELHAEAFNARLHQFLGQLRGGFVPGFVVVVGDVNALRAVLLEGRAMVGCEAVHPVARGYIPVARAPKGQRVDQRLAQDDVLGSDQRLFIPHAPMLAFQVQVVVRPAAQIVVDLPPVHLRHVTGWRNHRHDQRAVEMLVAALPVDAQLLQPAPHCRAVGAVLRRQAQPQRPVGEAQPETLDHLRRLQPPAFQIPLRLRRLVESVLIKAHDFQQQFAVPGLRRHRRGQLPHCALLHRLTTPATKTCRRGPRRSRRFHS